MHCTLHRWMGHSWIPGISMSWLRFQTWFVKRICRTGDLLIKTCRNWSNHPSTHYIPIKHFLENENFNVLIKLPFQYDIDVPFSQGKKLRFRFSAKKLWSWFFCAVSIASNCGQIADSSIKPAPTRVTVIWDEDNYYPHHHNHHTTSSPFTNSIIIEFHIIKRPAC